jgi:pyruvate/2-oxoglutarate dehydrogenase complex dihydrolipoamide dehydrogenase (E3) component
MQTPIDSVYAVADVTGICLLNSVATAQANVAVVTILSMAMRFGQSAQEIGNLPAVHPSATEVLLRTLRQRFDHPSFA